MSEISKIFAFTGVIFLLLSLLYNLSHLPRIPGDFYIDKAGFRVYIPWLSSIILSVILTLALNFFKK